MRCNKDITKNIFDILFYEYNILSYADNSIKNTL